MTRTIDVPTKRLTQKEKFNIAGTAGRVEKEPEKEPEIEPKKIPLTPTKQIKRNKRRRR